ncbi:MAG: DNA-deoxyinosine glycosylase [Methylococcales bacterium]|jgi:double-stranded uracil-DNA glycosylase|nr:DNA-deoxyinosine glycosylase [Methylococcales bacterium]MBT7445282.1 DNA-deoxyinosine glycosylase [Methylococcales bacterium]
MTVLNGFHPIASVDAKILILGSMPGVASLDVDQYYAHPRNAFWFILSEVLGFDLALSYLERCEQLLANRVAVWDVLSRCERQGSLDSAIKIDSELVNDFPLFLTKHPNIRAIYFNGGKAEQVFNRVAKPQLDDQRQLIFHKLPSTSPAMAMLTKEQKLDQWKVIKDVLEL